MAFDRRSGRPIACEMVKVDANSVSCEVLSEERYIGSVVQEAKPPKQKNVRYEPTCNLVKTEHNKLLHHLLNRAYLVSPSPNKVSTVKIILVIFGTKLRK